MSEEEVSERTPESPNMPAIEDVPASAGALTCPKGPTNGLEPRQLEPFLVGRVEGRGYS